MAHPDRAHFFRRQGLTLDEFASPANMKGCAGKIRHTSKRQAAGVLRVMQKDPTTTKPYQLRVYKCRICSGGWHVGHNDPHRKDRTP